MEIEVWHYLLALFLTVSFMIAWKIYREHKGSDVLDNAMLEHYEKYIVQGRKLNLPDVDLTNIRLYREEVAMFKLPAIRVQYRSTGKYYYSGARVRVRLGKEFFYNAGNINIREKGWMQTDNGELVVTSKRIIFIGEKYTDALDLGSIIRLGADAEVLRFDRTSGEPMIFSIEDANSLQIFVLWTLIYHRKDMDIALNNPV